MLENEGYTHKKGLVYKNQFQIVFCPKYRRKVLTDGVEERLREILYEVAELNEIDIKSLEIMPDHVQIMIEFDPRLTLHKVIRLLKDNSARILREEFPSLKRRIPSLWTRNYLSCSVGDISEDTIQKYIESQKNV